MYFHPVIDALEFFLKYYAPRMKYPWQIVATNCKIGLAVKRLTMTTIVMMMIIIRTSNNNIKNRYLKFNTQLSNIIIIIIIIILLIIIIVLTMMTITILNHTIHRKQ